MPRLLSLLASLALILSIAMGSLAHAAEGPACIAVPAAELSAHAPGDSDHVAADGDTPYPHHHGGCHSHQVGVPTLSEGAMRPMAIVQDFAPNPAVHLAPATHDPALRPPQA